MVRWAPRRGLRQFDLELAAQCQGDLLQKLERDGGVVGREQEVERGGAGFHAARQLRAGDAAALHLALKLPRDHALERAGLTPGQQSVLLEEVVEIRTEVLAFHGMPADTRTLKFEAVANGGCDFFEHRAGDPASGGTGKADGIE